MQFERYRIYLSHQEPSLLDAQSAESLPTEVLLANPTPFNLSELLWRIAGPVMSFILLLLAIPLSFVNPRGGRSANVVIALLLWVTYESMVRVVQELTKQGRLPFMMAWWPVHAVVLVIVLLLFAWRMNMNSRFHPEAILGSIKRVLIRKRVKP
jgi:lipopolysaccharide export system permease protein